MRLDKFLANLKYGSRNDIKIMCKKDLVKVNDKLASKSDLNIDPTKDLVYVNEELVYYKESVTLMMNKPSGYICSNVDEAYPSLLNILDSKYRRFDFSFAGRLDVDTEGLIILSTDGNVIHRITSPKQDVSKTYYVKTLKEISNEARLEAPMKLLDGKDEYYITNGAKVVKIGNFELLLTINEGKFHQVKRMLEAIDNKVVYLKRVKIGNLELSDDLEIGMYEEIDPNIIF